MSGAWRVVVPLVVVGLLAGGCTGDDPEPVATSSAPVESAEPTPTPSPTRDLTTRPERPEAMDEPTTDGAIAAATYVLELYGYSFAAADLGPWRAMTLDTCTFCAAVEDAVTEMVESGRTSSGSSVTVESATATEIAEARWYGVEMKIVQSESQRFDEEGNVVARGTGGPHLATFALSWSDGWQVDEMGVEPIDQAEV